MTPSGWRQRWPEWVGLVAAVWSLVYGALGAYWAAGGAGFPFGPENDPGARLSVLANARQGVVAPVIAALGLVGAAVATLMARGRGGGGRRVRVLLLAFAWAAAAALTVVIPDFRVLVMVAYAPILALGAPFGWPERIGLSDVIQWPILNQALCILGGIAWAATATVYQRRTRGACAYCGRADTDTVRARMTPDAVARGARWAVAVAVIVPVIYAITRFAWAFGIPLGITEKFFREGVEIGLWWRGAALAALALGGAVLKIGLIQPWGEIFPRWMPFVGGRAVPHALVVVPATFVAVIVTAAGLMFVRMGVAGTFNLGVHPVRFTENWAALWPELLWPIWGVALGLATLAYHSRTRTKCEHCGRQ
jgi:hypothetical protein